MVFSGSLVRESSQIYGVKEVIFKILMAVKSVVAQNSASLAKWFYYQ